jgi:Zn-dependent alcohol dehydrogenase
MDGKLQLEPLVSRTLASLDEINDAFAVMRSGSALRAVLLFPETPLSAHLAGR